MDMNQSNGLIDTNGQPHVAQNEGVPDFGRRNPLEIGVQLRNLVNRGDFLTVEYTGGQLVTRLLDVDVRERTFTFDWGALSDQNKELLSAPRCKFHATPDGVRVEFSTRTPRETRFEGLPAFEADFPEVLFYVQRREYFRVAAPILDPFMCTGRLPEGDAFRFEVHDLSLGGVGMRTTDLRVAQLPMGARLMDCELTLGARPSVARSATRVASLARDAQRHATLSARLPFPDAAGQRGKHAAKADHATRNEAPLAVALSGEATRGGRACDARHCASASACEANVALGSATTSPQLRGERERSGMALNFSRGGPLKRMFQQRGGMTAMPPFRMTHVQQSH